MSNSSLLHVRTQARCREFSQKNRSFCVSSGHRRSLHFVSDEELLKTMTVKRNASLQKERPLENFLPPFHADFDRPSRGSG
jgi:hypothetical protein